MRYSKKFNSSSIEMYDSTGLLKTGNIWLHISIDKDSVMVYISKNLNRYYWIGSPDGKSANLTIKFNDKNNSIKINSVNRIVFKKKTDYETLKKNAEKYYTMPDKSLIFIKRTKK